MYVLYNKFHYFTPEKVKEFNTLDDVIKYEINENNYLVQNYSNEYIPYDEYNKDVNFISWEHSNTIIKTPSDTTMYRFKKVCEWGKNRNVNGDWEYIPFLSCMDSGLMYHEWIEIDYSHKIFI